MTTVSNKETEHHTALAITLHSRPTGAVRVRSGSINDQAGTVLRCKNLFEVLRWSLPNLPPLSGYDPTTTLRRDARRLDHPPRRDTTNVLGLKGAVFILPTYRTCNAWYIHRIRPLTKPLSCPLLSTGISSIFHGGCAFKSKISSRTY
jgi:hypothetical protein